MHDLHQFGKSPRICLGGGGCVCADLSGHRRAYFVLNEFWKPTSHIILKKYICYFNVKCQLYARNMHYMFVISCYN